MTAIPRRRQPSPPSPDAKHRPRLTQAAIVHAALDLLPVLGLDDLTMRRLAATLGVQAAALYRYVRDKDELLALMADAICAEAVIPDPTLPWSEQLALTAHDQRRLLRSRRDAARLIAGTAPTGPERLRLINATLGTLLGAGFDANESFRIALLLTNFVTGAVLEEESNPVAAADRADDSAAAFAAASTAWLAALAAGDYPHLRRAAAAIDPATGFDADADFAYGLAILLAGLRQRQATTADPPPPPR